MIKYPTTLQIWLLIRFRTAWRAPNAARAFPASTSDVLQEQGRAGLDADLDGDFEWNVINTKNGRFGLE